ncbi:MAG: glycosyltransferase family 4 protein [Pseudomonadales bacterium]
MGGIQRHSAMLFRSLLAKGVSVDLYHTAYEEPAISDAKSLKGFSSSTLSSVHNEYVDYPRRGRYPGHYIVDSRAYSTAILDRIKKTDNYDFIYAQGITGLAIIESKLKGSRLPPVGVNCHGYEMYQRAAGFRAKAEHILLRPAFKYVTQNADYVFSFSGEIRRIVEARLGVHENQIIELPNAIESCWIVERPRPRVRRLCFVYVGRYERRKGIEEINQAILTMNESKLDFDFHFIGPIPEVKQVQSANVVYHGAVFEEHSLKDIYDHCDVLVCPSYSEGMPTVILEAMARGLAVVATDVGAVAELVDESNGVLIERPSSARLLRALVEMYELDDALLSRKKAESLNRVASYTWDEMVERLIEKLSSKLAKI